MSRNSLLEAGAISEVKVTATGFEPTIRYETRYVLTLSMASGCGFQFCCCHLNFRYGACFEQEVPGHSCKL